MITLIITTCKRYSLFQKTIKSLMANCEDIGLISQIILVDDNSDLSDMILMREDIRRLNIPCIFVHKIDNQGHANSLNIAWSLVKTDYILLIEDDWLSVKKDCYIKKAFEIFKQNDKIIQVQFRTNPDIMATGQEIVKVNDIEYIEYKYDVKARDRLGRPAWGGWTNNPSLINFKLLKENIGNINEDVQGFEWNYACRVAAKGFKVAYFPINYFEHIGKGNSAYKLNKTMR